MTILTATPTHRSRRALLRLPLAIAAIPMILGGYALGFSSITGEAACPFYFLTSKPCPGCGLTRAVVALVHGDVSSALHWNAVGLIGLLLAVILWVRLASARLRGEDRPFLNPRPIYLGVLMVVAAGWFLLRLTPWGGQFFSS